MANGAISDEDIVVSSGTGKGRPGEAWVPTTVDDKPTMAVTFSIATPIYGISVQGSYDQVDIEYTLNRQDFSPGPVNIVLDMFSYFTE
jgi:hypothetical protein